MSKERLFELRAERDRCKKELADLQSWPRPVGQIAFGNRLAETGCSTPPVDQVRGLNNQLDNLQSAIDALEASGV